jgi:DNA adenine methylase
MQYFGGKQRISKELGSFLNLQLKEGQPFVDLFCGSCNIITKINPDRALVANDKHKYVIAMWTEFVKGKEFPIKITKEDYSRIKANKDIDPAMAGFVGFGMSFGGKWFGGFTGEVSKNGQDYLKCATNGVKAKSKNLYNVKFYNRDYYNVPIPDGALIYCDIPYKGTTPYCKAEVGDFDHDEFYLWAKDMINIGHTVFISEYAENVPEGASIVWSRQSGTTNAAWQGAAKKTTEVLYTWEVE